ncbi:Hemolysin-type calcium-binding region protein [Hyella patelloides LEGE 07179]|uniref:Hemolysin-type calcium-binding region protein n=1 Tax=Hyella patelloides LEGE 07179 TaxID=945734 RepID=A0A563W4K7_9CYAN|nr:SGNH/GDSL hydrolase family protein [Hyella patelloides]VEP18632.1 Hemolysin-type calcium-binding region protein [Hyella patelloides LEGE 07179]
MLDLNDITQMIVFGDSLSDNGNSFALTLGAIPPPPYFDGRFSNGIVAVEYFAENLGLTLDPFYDDGEGNNFAVGGAGTGTGNSNNDDIAPFLPGVTLPGLANQIDAFASSLDSGNADPNGLYVVWAGPNDFLDYLGGSMSADPAALIEQGVTNIIDGVTRLTDLGAENLVVPNMPSLGRLPFSGAFQDEATAVSLAFNGGLSLALDNLELLAEPAEANAIEVDIFATTEAIIADPESFGLNNVTDPLLFSGLDLTTPGFFFWDLFHPTTEVHALVADTIAQTINGEIPQPTFNDIVGTAQRDFLFGTGNADNIDGLAGNDLILGRDGDDRLEGWDGKDRLFGHQGNDTIDGGGNRDYLWGGAGDDLLFGGDGKDRLFGNQGKDILIGGGNQDSLWGGADDDYVLGGDAKDKLYGNEGNDILNGGNGRDLIQGNQGDDLIDGGAGRDTLFGNAGADIFELTPDFGADRIADFQGGIDRFMLSGGLSFDDLSFGNENIFVTATNETLAIVSGFDTTTLTESDFA